MSFYSNLIDLFHHFFLFIKSKKINEPYNKIEKLVGDNKGKIICVDESLFAHDSNGQQV